MIDFFNGLENKIFTFQSTLIVYVITNLAAKHTKYSFFTKIKEYLIKLVSRALIAAYL